MEMLCKIATSRNLTFLSVLSFFYAVFWPFQEQFHTRRPYLSSLNQRYKKHIIFLLQMNFSQGCWTIVNCFFNSLSILLLGVNADLLSFVRGLGDMPFKFRFTSSFEDLFCQIFSKFSVTCYILVFIDINLKPTVLISIY